MILPLLAIEPPLKHWDKYYILRHLNFIHTKFQSSYLKNVWKQYNLSRMNKEELDFCSLLFAWIQVDKLFANIQNEDQWCIPCLVVIYALSLFMLITMRLKFLKEFVFHLAISTHLCHLTLTLSPDEFNLVQIICFVMLGTFFMVSANHSPTTSLSIVALITSSKLTIARS